MVGRETEEYCIHSRLERSLGCDSPGQVCVISGRQRQRMVLKLGDCVLPG